MKIVNHELVVEAVCIDSLQNITSLGPFPNTLKATHWESDILPLLKWQQTTIRETTEITSLSLLYKSEQKSAGIPGGEKSSDRRKPAWSKLLPTTNIS